MTSQIFDALLRENADIFRAAFSSVSTEVFYDPSTKRLRHAGEYGMFRETIVRDFLKFVTPRSLDMSTGFVITSKDDVSTQCDIVVFDSRMTPLYQEGDRQRFFPVESVFCIGEVKSKLSRGGLAASIPSGEQRSRRCCGASLWERCRRCPSIRTSHRMQSSTPDFRRSGRSHSEHAWPELSPVWRLSAISCLRRDARQSPRVTLHRGIGHEPALRLHSSANHCGAARFRYQVSSGIHRTLQ